jgi:putative membrane protein
MKIIRYFSSLIGKFLFLVFLVFALIFAFKNSEFVTLNLFLGHTWQLPLNLLLLIFLVAGAILGVVAWLPRVFRDKREIQALRRQLGGLAPVVPDVPRVEAVPSPPPVDAVL